MTTILTGSLTSPSATTNAVNSRSAASERMLLLTQMTNALMGGTGEMREQGETYLPKWPEEEDDSYSDRLDKSTLFPAYRRTVVTLAARPFSKAITIKDDTPPAFTPWLDNIDLQGNNLDAFMSARFKRALGDGLAGILVEYPRRPINVNTIADEKALALRPYFVAVNAGNILGWRTVNVNGSIQLTQLRLLEEVEEDLGEFGTTVIQQVRVLEIGKWTTYRAQKSAGTVATDWQVYDSGITTLKEIPFVPIFGERVGFLEGRPPLLELAYLNVKHWQQQSDQDNLMHVARVPILTVRGVDDKFALTIGTSAAVNLGESPTAQMVFVEHSGAAIQSGKVQLDDLKEEMRQSGAELLVMKQGATSGPATATEVASDNAVGMCALQDLANDTEDALDQALQFMAEYVGEAQGGHTEVFKDFGAATLADASYQMLISMSTTGKLSNETLIDEGKRRGILNSEVDWLDEKDKMDAEGPPPGMLLVPGQLAPPNSVLPPDPNAKPKPGGGGKAPPFGAKKKAPATA